MGKTMKKISIIICILNLTILNFAQNSSPISDSWQTYISSKDDFSIDTPTKFFEYYYTSKNSTGKETYLGTFYNLVYDQTNVYIFSDVTPSPINEKSVLPTSPLKIFIRENNAVSKIFSIGNQVGDRYDFKDSEGFFHKIIFVQTKERNFIFHTVSESSSETDSEHFLNSIKLRLSDHSETNETKKVNPLPTTSPISTTGGSNKNGSSSDGAGTGAGVGRGQGSGSGNGSGSGSGIGSGTGNGIGSGTNSTPSQPTKSPTTPLTILTKPKPPYTELARAYQISGSVTLRVTFLSNGEIGTITPVKKIPFGLTNNAINAAKLIRFNPPTKDGTPYSVVKMLQYTFTMY